MRKLLSFCAILFAMCLNLQAQTVASIHKEAKEQCDPIGVYNGLLAKEDYYYRVMDKDQTADKKDILFVVELSESTFNLDEDAEPEIFYAVVSSLKMENIISTRVNYISAEDNLFGIGDAFDAKIVGKPGSITRKHVGTDGKLVETKPTEISVLFASKAEANKFIKTINAFKE